MKKLFLVSMLAMLSMTGNLFAQNEPTWYIGRSASDHLFDVGQLPALRHRFVIRLQNANNVTIKVGNKEEFEKLLNLDSLIKVVVKNLALLKDSLQDETTQKRVDYLNDANGPVKIRIRQHQPNGTSYVLQADGPALLKIEQDSLNIIGYLSKPVNSVRVPTVYVNIPYYISFLINDINNLEKLADGTLNKVMQEIKEQWDDMNNWSPKKNNTTNLYAYYSIPQEKFITPMKIQLRVRKWSFRPYVQMAIQNINNIFTGSTGVGFEVSNNISSSFKRSYQLMWEPYFFFERQPENKFPMQRNDFITFQTVSRQTNYFPGSPKVQVDEIVSIGYLVHRTSNYFSKNTFKIGLPGASFRFVNLHPEFIFHDLFKGFQPGLKLMLDLD